MTEFFFKFPLFYRVTEEVQSRKIQNNIPIFHFPAQFSAEFPRSKDKRAGATKKIFCRSLPYFYICPDQYQQFYLDNGLTD